MSDIDTAVVKSLKALDPKRPIREADMSRASAMSAFEGKADITYAHRYGRIYEHAP